MNFLTLSGLWSLSFQTPICLYEDGQITNSTELLRYGKDTFLRR
jgi:hypothetical protein